MTKRNGTLDVLRCAAIVLVVNGHVASTFGAEGATQVLKLGGKGVDLFFVLSGWLLGYQLFKELRDTGWIEVRRFWYRRWLRTLPAYYFILALTFLWQVVARRNYDPSWSYLFFGQNYFTDFPYFGISWSLCVEEHFYLAVAPLLLLAFRCRPVVYLLPLLLAIPSVCRFMGWYGATHETHVRYDQCAAGVLLAYPAVFVPTLWRWLCRLAPILVLMGLAAAAFFAVAYLNRHWGVREPGPLVCSLVFGTLVLLANSSEFWKCRVHFYATRYVADRAYSLYLVHIEALTLVKRLEGLQFILSLGLTWLISLVLAEILYRLVERPLMQARERFASARSQEKLVPGVATAEASLPAQSEVGEDWRVTKITQEVIAVDLNPASSPSESDRAVPSAGAPARGPASMPD